MKLRIHPKSRRGRTFEVELLTSIQANVLWGSGDSRNFRPIYLAFASTHEAARAFVANLRMKRGATLVNEYGRDEGELELMKSAVYRWTQRRTPDGLTICEVYMPEVVALDPGVVSDEVKGLVMVPSWWVDRQVAFFADYPAGDRREMAVATWFAAFIDNRVEIPIYRDPGYYLEVWRGLQKTRAFRERESVPKFYPHRFGIFPTEPEGFEKIEAFDCQASNLNRFLNKTLKEFFENGSTRIPSPRGLLSNAR